MSEKTHYRKAFDSPNDLSDESHKALCRIAGIVTTEPSGGEG